MRLKKELLVIVMIILIVIIISIPIKSNAICTNISIKSDVGAVRLTLSDGRVLHYATFAKDYKTITKQEAETSIIETNIIFIVDTSIGMEKEIDNVKEILKTFSDDIYNNVPYSYVKDKLKMLFIGFDYKNKENKNENVPPYWTNDNEDCEKQIDSLTIEGSDRSLEEACNLAKDNFDIARINSMSNNALTTTFKDGNVIQFAIIISNGLDDLQKIEKPKQDNKRQQEQDRWLNEEDSESQEKIEYIYTTDEKQIQRASTILSTLSKDEMVLIQGISIKSEEKQNEELEKLYQYINESGGVAPNNWIEEVTDMKDVLIGNILEDIRKKSLYSKTIKPYTDLKDGAVTPDTIMLFADNELIQGATLEIEYVFETLVWGLGDTYEQNYNVETEDFIGRNLLYDENHKLLSDPSKKNSDFNWTIEQTNNEDYQFKLKTKYDIINFMGREEEKIIKEEKRLVVSTTITTDTFENDGYENKAITPVFIKGRVDDETNYKYPDVSLTVENEAMKVVIIPPTGEDERFEKYWYWIVLAFILVVSTIFAVIKRKINKNK